MPIKVYPIEDITGGISRTYYEDKSSYTYAVGIDPDLPIQVGSKVKTSGIISPSSYSVFSGVNVNATPLWLETDPKDTKIYTYLTNGKFISYSSTFASETVIATAATSTGNGLAYYNNYIYVLRNTDIDRYGPLNNSPTYTTGVWTGATLGSQTALTNNTYPTIRQAALPNHAAHVHGDGNLYFCDVNAQGQGILNKISTTKVTDQGDTNNGSAYNVLDLPFGYYPTCIESWGTDLVVGAIQTSGQATNTQGRAALFFWDTFAASFYRAVPLPDSAVSALKNVNGKLYVFTGNLFAGVRVSEYVGGETLSQVFFQEEGSSPFAGAVDRYGDRVIWGGYTTYPIVTASVFAYGSKDARTKPVIHNIATSTSVGTTNIITAARYIQEASGALPRLTMAWTDSNGSGIDKFDASGTQNSAFIKTFNIGRKFRIAKIVIELDSKVSSGVVITPTLLTDDETTTKNLTAINNTNYPSMSRIVYKQPEIATVGQNDFVFKLAFTGTVVCDVKRVEIHVDVNEADKSA